MRRWSVGTAWAVSVFGLFGLWATPATAQFSGGAELRTEAVTFDSPETVGIDWIGLAVTPWDAALAVGDWGIISVAGGYAIAHLEGEGSASEEVYGTTDTKLTVDIFLGERALLSVGGTLPTGKTQLTATEFGISGILAAQSLPFSMASWGSGGRLGADLVADVSPLPSTRVTLLAGYHFAQEYEPLEVGSIQYRPGNEISLRAAVEQYVKGITLGLTLGLQNFGDDRVQGQNLFQAGTRTQAVLSAAIPFGETGSAVVWGSMTSRGSGTAVTGAVPVLDGATDQDAQDLVQAGGALRLAMGGAVLVPELDIRAFRTDGGAGEGLLSGFSLSAELPISQSRRGGRVFLAPSARIRTGHVERANGEEEGIKAYEFSLGVRWEAGR